MNKREIFEQRPLIEFIEESGQDVEMPEGCSFIPGYAVQVMVYRLVVDEEGNMTKVHMAQAMGVCNFPRYIVPVIEEVHATASRLLKLAAQLNSGPEE